MMKKKFLKPFVYGLGILLAIILIGNLALNYWLQHSLPKFLKENTDYTVAYKKMDVDLGTGNVFASGISIRNKKEKDTSVLRIQGNIDTLKINRLGLFKLLFKKQLRTSGLEVGGANLTFHLPPLKTIPPSLFHL